MVAKIRAAALAALLLPLRAMSLAVRITEIAYRGSDPDVCSGEDWIELHNPNPESSANLAGYVLHDDNGMDDEDAKTFRADSVLGPGEYLLLCKDVDFDFGIGRDDNITLLDADGAIASEVVLPGTGGDDETYIYIEGNGGNEHTDTPAPGTNCAGAVSVCLALDTSGSVCSPDPSGDELCEGCPDQCHEADDFEQGICCQNFSEATDFALGLVDSLAGDVDPQISVVTFSTSAVRLSGLTAPDAVSQGLRGALDYEGGHTNHAEAIAMCQDIFAAFVNPDRTNVILLLTDGVADRPEVDPLGAAIDAAGLARAAGTAVVPVFVGPGDKVGLGYMSQLSGDGEAMNVASFNELSASVEGVVRLITCAGSEDPVAPGGYEYTGTPTPGDVNVLSAAALEGESGEDLVAREAAGDAFFLVDDGSEDNPFGEVMDIEITMDEKALEIINDHPAWQEWVDFDSLAISPAGGADVPIATSGGGRVRVKGQSTNTLTTCLGQSNVPFTVRFDEPFLGMGTVYFRNHLGDQSYMRDHANNVALRVFGLPYLRTRPARLYINGEYLGFYTVMEAPEQAYVMQRSFGEFDPSRAALYKMKSLIAECPYPEEEVQGTMVMSPDVPDPYYFERGDHKMDTPMLGPDSIEECTEFFFGELMKERNDIIRGYAEYDRDCGLAMVELGQIDRDFGPKETEDAMVSFLRSKFYNQTMDDLSDSVDRDQWLKNFAIYAVMLGLDSLINNINNWYLATTKGGEDDWRIVQYDHNNAADAELAAGLCDPSCRYRMVYWPILRPTCLSVEEHMVVGRIMNNEESVQKYLGYVREFVDVLDATNFLDEMRAYGDGIKEYVVDDPYSTLTVEEYEARELTPGAEGYNAAGSFLGQGSPFLKTMEKRLEQVRAQLDAIDDGTLPRDGIYGAGEACPDWRAPSGEDFTSGSTISESCPFSFCEEAAGCYGGGACADGEFIIEACAALSPTCDSCFPYSSCGTGGADVSGSFVEGDECGPELAACAEAADCFNHKIGMCAFDGAIEWPDCDEALPFCKPCYPCSRCGSPSDAVCEDAPNGELPVAGADSSGLFIAGESCGPELAQCAEASLCFAHSGGCATDGTIEEPQCQLALPFCEPCYPNSRCGTGDASGDASGLFVEGEACGPELAQCAQASLCFAHSGGCAADGTIEEPQCQLALPFCEPCYPNSRCGSGSPPTDADDSGLFVEGEACSGVLVGCADASWCFEHDSGCAADGEIESPDCQQALPICNPCFPNSRCSSLSTTVEGTAFKDTASLDEAPVEAPIDASPQLMPPALDPATESPTNITDGYPTDAVGTPGSSTDGTSGADHTGITGMAFTRATLFLTTILAWIFIM